MKLLSPQWDLSDLYSGLDDPKIKKDTQENLKRAQNFNKRYQGKLTNQNISAQSVLNMLREYESILQESSKPAIYASFLFAADTANPRHGALLQETKKKRTEIYQELIFFTLGLTQLSDVKFKKLVADSLLKNYAHFLKQVYVFKPHRLSESEERILKDKALTGEQAFIRLFDEETSEKEYKFTFKAKTIILSEEEVLDLLYNNNRAKRKAASEVLTKGLEEESRRLTFIFNMLGEDKAINDRHQKYATPEEERHLENETDQETIDMLSSVVVDSYSLVQKFYRFKKKILGVQKLYDYDRYASIATSSTRFSFAEAREIIISAFRQFSPEYAKAADMFFEHGWIDAAQRKGRRAGAFCNFVTPDLHPYIFINFLGTAKDVQTLAHELGHGIHALLARKQTNLNFTGPLTIAETASVFGETLVFDALKNLLTDKQEKSALYVENIERIFATVFRQISMYRFEQEFHKARREQGELSIKYINSIWRKTQVEMFGNSVHLTSNYDLWWSYIPHFVHSPFYVYAYAFGELLTLSLYMRYQKEGKQFISRYLDLLRTGGSQSPDKLVEPFGINLRERKFWEGGIEVIRQLITEVQVLKK